MRRIAIAPALFLLALVASCETTGLLCCGPGQPSLRVVNAFTTSVDVLVDGNVAISGLAAGSIGTAAPSAGSHALVLRPTGSSGSATHSFTTTEGAMNTIAAVRAASGAVASIALDDTNSVVPAGKTKVRVLHLAPNAGEITVYRTQPDYLTPVSWQFPFTYQANPDPLSAPFYQSDVGTWEVRIWQTASSGIGWANAPVKVVIPLGSGEKKTVVVLDAPGGGVKIEVL